MKLTSDADKKVGLMAEVMTRMHVRASTISQLSPGVTAAQSRKLHKMIHIRSSPSGQQPMDFKWYLKDKKLRYHSVFFLALYKAHRRVMSESEAIVLAYFKYANVMPPENPRTPIFEGLNAFRGCEKDYLLPFSRAHVLAKTYTESKDNRDRHKCPLTIKKCRICSAAFLGMRDQIEAHCPTCDENHPATKH
jgi:hypothetical protein